MIAANFITPYNPSSILFQYFKKEAHIFTIPLWLYVITICTSDLGKDSEKNNGHSRIEEDAFEAAQCCFRYPSQKFEKLI